jgi:hypothetical protein
MASERKALFRRDVLFPHVSNFPLPSRANAFRPFDEVRTAEHDLPLTRR